MRIKHWQGYGTVNARKVAKTTSCGRTRLVVEVTGNHEWGLVRDDEYDLINWLVKKFDKNFTGNRVSYSYEDGYRNTGRIDEEYCVYTFVYRGEWDDREGEARGILAHQGPGIHRAMLGHPQSGHRRPLRRARAAHIRGLQRGARGAEDMRDPGRLRCRGGADMPTYAVIDPEICPACGSDATEWAPFDEEIYEVHDDISGNIAAWGEEGIADIRVGRRCRACGEGYVVDMRVNLDACRCVDKKRMDPPGSANPLSKPFPNIQE